MISSSSWRSQRTTLIEEKNVYGTIKTNCRAPPTNIISFVISVLLREFSLFLSFDLIFIFRSLIFHQFKNLTLFLWRPCTLFIAIICANVSGDFSGLFNCWLYSLSRVPRAIRFIGIFRSFVWEWWWFAFQISFAHHSPRRSPIDLMIKHGH